MLALGIYVSGNCQSLSGRACSYRGCGILFVLPNNITSNRVKGRYIQN